MRPGCLCACGSIEVFTIFLSLGPPAGNVYHFRGLAYVEKGVADSVSLDFRQAAPVGIKEALGAGKKFYSAEKP